LALRLGPPEDLHPQWALSLVWEGKPRLIHLPAALAEEARRGVQLHPRFQQMPSAAASVLAGAQPLAD